MKANRERSSVIKPGALFYTHMDSVNQKWSCYCRHVHISISLGILKGLLPKKWNDACLLLAVLLFKWQPDCERI